MGKNHVYEDEEARASYTSSSGVSEKLTYLLVGGGIGAIVALLFAPKAGRELRTDIADATRKGYDKTLESAQQLKEQSGNYYQQIKEQAGNVYNRAGEVYSAAADKFRQPGQQTIDSANKALNSAAGIGDEIADNVEQSDTGFDSSKQAEQPTM